MEDNRNNSMEKASDEPVVKVAELLNGRVPGYFVLDSVSILKQTFLFYLRIWSFVQHLILSRNRT